MKVYVEVEKKVTRGRGGQRGRLTYTRFEQMYAANKEIPVVHTIKMAV